MTQNWTEPKFCMNWTVTSLHAGEDTVDKLIMHAAILHQLNNALVLGPSSLMLIMHCTTIWRWLQWWGVAACTKCCYEFWRWHWDGHSYYQWTTTCYKRAREGNVHQGNVSKQHMLLQPSVKHLRRISFTPLQGWRGQNHIHGEVLTIDDLLTST